MKQKRIRQSDKIALSYDNNNEEMIYVIYFNKLPSIIYFNNIIYELESFKDKLKKWNFNKITEISNDNILSELWVKQNYMIKVKHYPNNKLLLHIYYDCTDYDSLFLDEIKDFANKYKQDNKCNNTIGIITTSYDGLDIDYVDYNLMDISLSNNYNDDFYKISEKMIEDLSKKYHGLHILHGSPGTGKTTFIKYLINNINKNFIFIPPGFISSISDPQFLTLLVSKAKDSVIIIEDAEEALMSSDGLRNSSVSNILNLADGLLGSVLNVQIIATFNSDFSDIDRAILRKGRLLNIYEFGKLSLEKTNSLLKSLNFEESSTPMVLADIYNNSVELDIKKTKNTIKL